LSQVFIFAACFIYKLQNSDLMSSHFMCWSGRQLYRLRFFMAVITKKQQPRDYLTLYLAALFHILSNSWCSHNTLWRYIPSYHTTSTMGKILLMMTFWWSKHRLASVHFWNWLWRWRLCCYSKHQEIFAQWQCWSS